MSVYTGRWLRETLVLLKTANEADVRLYVAKAVSGVSGCWRLFLKFAVCIIPLPADAFKTAEFMQPVCLSPYTVFGNELHSGVRVILLLMAADLKADPFQFRIGRVDCLWPCSRVPCCQ